MNYAKFAGKFVFMRKLIFLTVLPMLLLSACGDDESMVITSSKQISLHKGEQSQIEVISEQPVRFGSMDEFHATVDENGLITANYVGETMVGVKSGSEQDYITVNVVPVSSLLVEPYHSDFTVRKDIIEKMYGEEYSSSGDGIIYTLDEMGASASFGFYFAGDKDVLYRSEVVLKPGTSMDAVKLFLEERYMPVAGEEGKYQDTFDGGAGTVFVRVAENDEGIITVSYSNVK